MKPTKIVGDNGYVYNTANLDQTPAIAELKEQVRNIVLDTLAIQEVRNRVYQLEIVNGAVNERIDGAESTANEAKTTANAAHTYASGVYDRVVEAESTANKAQEKAIEAKNQLSSISTDYQNLKTRIEDLEATDGEASIPIVGNSAMGYVTDFTKYGHNGEYYAQVTWNGESRSLQFGKESKLGDVIEELMHVIASGITTNHDRISALENGGGSGSGTTSFEYTAPQYGCANDMYGYKDYTQPAQLIVMSIPDALDVIQSNIDVNKEIISDHTTKIKAINEYDLDGMSRNIDDMGRAIFDLENAISQMSTMTTGGDDLLVIDQQISTLNNRVTLLENNTTTNTTKIGVHTTDIAAMLNRIVDLETTVQTQSRLISELTTRLEALEQK